MNITIDMDRFDDLQLRVLEELVISIRDGLREAGVTEHEALYEATGKLAFSIAAIFDGSCEMELGGEQVVPCITFAKERNGSDLIAAEGGSWMHEYVFGTVEDVFELGDEG